MDTSIVLIFAVIVVVSIVVIGFSQMREKAKIERARKITALENRFRHAKKLFMDIPGQYLSPELKLLLLKRMEEVALELGNLKTNKPVDAWLAETQELKQAVEAGADQRPSIKIDSESKSQDINELLESLFKLIESLHQSGRLNKETARRTLRQVLFLIHKTHADLHIYQAREFIRQNEIRKAINAYHMASTELGKSKDNPLATKVIKTLRTRIKELDALPADGNPQQPKEGPQQLDKEWDSFLEVDSWKKKADYDD